ERRGGLELLAERPSIDRGWAHLVVAVPPRVFLATLDDHIVGYLLLGSRDVAEGRVAVIEQVYITPEAREIGFGDWLVEAATEQARADGAVAIEAEPLPGDRELKNLYERAGITARKLVVYRRL